MAGQAVTAATIAEVRALIVGPVGSEVAVELGVSSASRSPGKSTLNSTATRTVVLTRIGRS